MYFYTYSVFQEQEMAVFLCFTTFFGLKNCSFVSFLFDFVYLIALFDFFFFFFYVKMMDPLLRKNILFHFVLSAVFVIFVA